jgi:hypothetical protein
MGDSQNVIPKMDGSDGKEREGKESKREGMELQLIAT